MKRRATKKAKAKRRPLVPARFCECLPGKLEQFKQDGAEAQAAGNADLADLMKIRVQGVGAMLKRYCRKAP